jgi:hypothetical protein
MRSVTFRSTGVTARIARSARGRSAGTLTINRKRAYHLRVPHTGATLLHRGSLRVVLHPGAQRFVTVSGLPSGSREVSLRLGKRLIVRSGCRYSAGATIVGQGATVTVGGGGATTC